MALASFIDGVQTPTVQGGSLGGSVLNLKASTQTIGISPIRIQPHIVSVTGIQDFTSCTPSLTWDASGQSVSVLEVGSEGFGTRVPWRITSDLISAVFDGARVFTFRPLITNVVNSTSTARAMGQWVPFISNANFRADGASGGSVASGIFRHLYDTCIFRTVNGAVGNVWSEYTSVYSAPDIAANWTLANRYGLNYQAAIGAGATTTETVINIAGMTAATRLTLVNGDATAQIRHAGPAVFGANAGPSATNIGLELQSTTKGFRLPRMSTTQRNTAFGAPPTGYDGTMIYNNDVAVQAPQVVQAGAWVTLP